MGPIPTVRKPGRLARVVDGLHGRAIGLPGARNPYAIETAIRVPTRDGAHLLTDHYRPLNTEPRGTALVRTPYGRGLPASLWHGRMLAARGYHVLIQSCRGTFGSTGTFRPVTQEAADATDTISWLREQKWFDGRLATLGASYLGWTQWALQLDPPPELRAAVVLVGPHDFGRVVYGTGAFTLNDFLGWSASVTTMGRGGRLRGLFAPIVAGRRVRRAMDRLPLADAADAALAGRAPWFRDWLSHPDLDDDFWAPRTATEVLHRTEVPTLLIGGWQDTFLTQTLEQYRALAGRGVDVALTIGPWTHADIVVRSARVTDPETLSWLDVQLAGNPRRPRRPVRIYVTGADEWRQLPDWPPATTTRTVRPHPDGRLANITGTGTVSFIYDPADPTPALGGRVLARRAGTRDNAALESRPDVVTFTTAPLAADLEILGSPVVELELSTDNPHADLFVRLCDVDPRGRSRNITDALRRLDPLRRLDTIRLELDPCAHRLLAGHALRLQVSGGAHPRFGRNPGTGAPPGTGTTLVPTRYTIHCGGSSITLPVPLRPG